jgi:O-antigen ligase
MLWFGAFIGWGWVGYVVSNYPDAVWDAAYAFLKLWLIALVTVNALRTRAQLRFFIVFWLTCFAFWPTRGTYFNYYIYNQRPFGRAVWNHIYANPNDLATLTILQLSMACSLLMTERKSIVRTAALVGVGTLTLLVFMTQSRGAILAISVFGIAAFVNAKHQRLRTLVIFGAVAAVLMIFAPSKVWNRIKAVAHVSTENVDLRDVDQSDMGSAAQRFEIWKVARKIISEQPVFGVGVGAYPLAHNQYSQGAEFSPIARGLRDTHSTYLNVTAETGFPGLILFLGTFAAVALPAERVRKRARAVMPAVSRQLAFLELGLLAYFMAGVFGSYSHLSFTYLHAVLVWAFAEAVSAQLAAARRPVWSAAAVGGARAARVGAPLPARPRLGGA